MTALWPEAPARSLSERIAAARPAPSAVLAGPQRRIALDVLATRALVEAPPGTLAGRSVLVRTHDALAAAAALAHLDGLAERLILCPPDLGREALVAAAMSGQAEAILTDSPDASDLPPLPVWRIELDGAAPRAAVPTGRTTQWALFTSGTSGAPKLAGHTLAGLSGAIAPLPAGAPRPGWATFYDVRRYGGLQMLLRALLGGFSLHATDPSEPLAAFLARIAEAGVTHVAGTPSHWRRALMSPALDTLRPDYLRLSGEIADQAVLDALRARFPRARIGHAYASTEAGVGFEVTDGLQGFPASLVEREDGPVRMRVVRGALQFRSPRTASGYLGMAAPVLRDAEGWVDSGDLVERRGERFHFVGRANGTINVGGLKVSPEEVEAVINGCPGVRASRVAGRPSPLLGALVSAEVVLDGSSEPAAVREAIGERCRAALASHKAPASIRFVDALPLGPGGKLERRRDA